MKIDPGLLPLPQDPYRGILPFRLLDWRIFLERDVESERLANLVSMYRGVLLYGQSGAGKSSLLNAGLLPLVLRKRFAPERIRVFPEHGRELLVERIRLREEGADSASVDGLPAYLPSQFTPADNDERVALSCTGFWEHLRTTSDLGVPLLIFDQFEELVTLFEENPKDQDRFASAQAARQAIEKLLCELLLNHPLPLKIIFAFRDDYLARLTPLLARIPNLLDQRVLLLPPRMESARKIVRGPFVTSEDGERGLPGHFKDTLGENELSEALAEKIAAGLGGRRLSGILNLSEVQTLCLALWRQPKLRADLLGAKDPTAVLQTILESEALSALNGFPPLDRIRALALLSNLVTEEGTRDVVSEQNLLNATRSNPVIWVFRGDLLKLLAGLYAGSGLLRRSLSAGTTYYELASEFLIPWIQQQQQKFRTLALIIWSYVFAGVLVLLLLMGYLTYWAVGQKHAAEAATQRATAALEETTKAKQAAEAATKRAEQEKTNAEAAAQRATTALEETTKAKQAAEAATKRAEQEKANAEAATLRTTAALEETTKAKQAAEAATKRAEQEKTNAEAAAQRATNALEEVKLSKAAADAATKRAEVGEELAQKAKDKAVAAKKAADELINFMQYDLRDVLEKLGRLDLMTAINARIRQYHEEHPAEAGDLDALREKGVALQQQGDLLQAQGHLQEASDQHRAALKIFQELLAQSPDSTDYQRNLSVCYDRVGGVQSDQNDLTGALQSNRDSLAIAEKLAKQDPGNAGWQRDLSISYNNVGGVQRAQGNLTGALQSYRDSLAIAEKLTKQDPSNAQWQRGLSVSYIKVGNVQSAQGELAGALQSYCDSLAIAEKLAKQNPGNAEWQRDLSISYIKVGGVQRAQGDLAGALQSNRDSLVIAEKLAKQDPGNAGWQRDLSVSYDNVGGVQSAQNDLAGALQSYRDSLAIREKLAKQDPGNAQWQLDLGYSARNVALVLLDQEKPGEAKPLFGTFRAIADRLGTADPANYIVQTDRANSRALLADCEDQKTPQGRAQAQALLREAVKILEALKGRTGLQPGHEGWLRNYQEDLTALEKPAK